MDINDKIKIYNDDCLNVMRNIDKDSIDLIVTDPPYLINYKTNYRKNKEDDFCKPIKGDDDYKLIENYIKECYRILKNNSAMYIFCNGDRVDYFKQNLEKAGFKIKI